MTRDDLAALSKDELIELVLTLAVQAARVETLTRQVAELEARVGEPPKGSGISRVPPPRDRKANRPRRPRGLRREASVGRAGGGRALHPDPDAVVIARLTRCPRCQAAIAEADQDLVERHGGICRYCGARVVAPVPQGLEPGSPFGTQ